MTSTQSQARPWSKGPWTETWRVLAYTLAISAALIGLRDLEQSDAVIGALSRLMPTGESAAGLASETTQVERASRAALQRLPPLYRQAAFRLGYELGFANYWLGSFAMSPIESQNRANALAERHLAVARALAQQLGVGEVVVLRVLNAADFVALSQRIEDDESGLAGRVERQLSLHHRHLCLLGMHVGTEAARVETTGGTITLPQEALIRRHATATGIPPALWEPLAFTDRGETPPQVVARYRASLNALNASLGAADTSPK
jgi:hypothetical protein